MIGQAMSETVRASLMTFISRKFVVATGTIASATALVSVGKIADGVYSAVVIAVVAAYLTANVTQKVKA